MKKFFSLVLALVMALSLTTVAWGADVTVTHTGDNAASGTALYNAVMAAADGDTINVGAGTYYLTNGQTSRFNLNNKSVTIVGAGEGMTILQGERYGVVLSDNVNPDSTTTFTLKNMTIESVGTGSAVYAKDDVTVNLVDVTLAVQGGTAILLDSCNEIAGAYHDGVETVVNVTNVTIPDGKKIEIAANPVSSIPNAGVVSYGSVNIGAGNNFTAADVQPQNISQGTNNIAVNGSYINVGTSSNKGTLYTADGLKTKQAEATDFVYVPAKALSKSVTTGNVAYYTSATAGIGNVWMVVGAADAVNTDSILKIGGTEKYVRAVAADDVYYVATATAYTNIGEKCGQIVDDGFGTKYYTLKDNEGKAIDGYFVEGTQGNVLLGTAVVGMATANPTIVDHVWKEAAYDKDGYCNALKCENCPATAKLYKPGTVPAGVVSEASGYPVYELMVVKAPAAPSTDKVQSAETFDAGIAMYVGMSVMAAAGSAVVIGKKKD